MISRLLRTRAPAIHYRPFLIRRNFHNVPFHDDLTPADDDFLNLDDFQHYREAPDVKAYREKLGIYDPDSAALTIEKNGQRRKDHVNEDLTENRIVQPSQIRTFEQACTASQPVVFVSKVSDPYLNLAIEDYVYNKMPLPDTGNCNRLMFYVNSPCVVVGKNQNPWKEVNIPLLADLRIPLVRRRSGGGTVVHDLGNVNYSFMTSKEKFDRFTFANLVVRAVNGMESAKVKITVNDRGDIVTQNTNEKVSGSAYKLSRGKSYHHGTMLLDSKLDVLRKLLHRDEANLGEVHAPSSVASVKSPVANLYIGKEGFIEAVTKEFQHAYGNLSVNENDAENGENELDQTDLLGLQGFVDAFSERKCAVFEIDDNVELPQDIATVREELKAWEWKFGATSKFQHVFHNTAKDVHVTIHVEKKGVVSSVEVEGPEDVTESFQFLKDVVARGDRIQYTGSNVAGFIVDDELSEWLGNAIDGTT